MKSVDGAGHELFEQMRRVSRYYLTHKFKHNMAWGSDSFILDLRESIWFRIMALQWHCQQIEEKHYASEAAYFDAIERDELFTLISNNQTIQYVLFDDIVYNLLSLFEYTGNLVGFFWKEEHGKSKKWKGISGAAMDENNPFSTKDISKTIDEAHRTLVTHLEEYRAQVFHYKFHEVDSYGLGLSLDYSSSDGKINVQMTDSFKKVLKGFDVPSDEGRSEVLTYSEFVTLESFKVVSKIFDHLLKWHIDPIPYKIKCAR